MRRWMRPVLLDVAGENGRMLALCSPLFVRLFAGHENIEVKKCINKRKECQSVLFFDLSQVYTES